MEAADIIKYIRRRTLLTQKELAKRAKVSVAWVSKVESGETKNPGFATMQRVIESSGINRYDIMTSLMQASEKWKEHLLSEFKIKKPKED